MKIHKVELTDRQVLLIRVALLQRMDRLKEKPGNKSSYDDTRAMMVDGGPLSLASLNVADITKEVRKTAKQIGSEPYCRDGYTAGSDGA